MVRKLNRLLPCLAALALIWSAGLTQENFEYKELSNFHKVNNQLYRGAQPGSGGLKRLSQLGVKTILNLRDNDSRAAQEQADASNAGLRYFNVPLGRLGRPGDDEMARALSIISNPENQPVFVHCKHGADRTGVVIAVYRITHDGWTSEQAKAEAKRYGMHPWELGMKDYIRDSYKHQVEQSKTAAR